MSGQGSGSARSFSSKNVPQAQQAPQQLQQPTSMFNRGRALFDRLQANNVQEYREFQ